MRSVRGLQTLRNGRTDWTDSLPARPPHETAPTITAGAVRRSKGVSARSFRRVDQFRRAQTEYGRDPVKLTDGEHSGSELVSQRGFRHGCRHRNTPDATVRVLNLPPKLTGDLLAEQPHGRVHAVTPEDA